MFVWMTVRHGNWIMTWSFNGFGTKYLCRILGYHWNDCVKPATHLMKLVRSATSLMCKWQVHLHGNVAWFLEVDAAFRVVYAKDKLEWRRPLQLIAGASDEWNDTPPCVCTLLVSCRPPKLSPSKPYRLILLTRFIYSSFLSVLKVRIIILSANIIFSSLAYT